MPTKVQIILEGKDNASDDIKRVRSSLGDLNKTPLSGITASLTKLGSIVGTGLVIGAGAAAAAFTKFAYDGFNAAADLEQQMSGIAAVLGKTAAEVAPLNDLIQDLALNPNLTVNTQEAADAIQMLARNGLDMDTIMAGAAESVVALANATGGEFAQSADVMTDAMKQFGIEASDLGVVVDGINGVVNNSKFAMNDMALALAQGGGVASDAGVEFDDFATTIAAISPLFSSGSDAGTSFKTFLNSLSPSTKTAKAAMQELGLWTEETGSAFYDASGNLRDMNEIAGILNSSLSGLTEEQRSNALETIFGTDAMRAAAGVAGFTSEEFTALSDKVNTTGSAFASASTRMDNFRGDMDIFQGVVESLSIKLGQELLPVMRPVIQAFTDFATIYGPPAIDFVVDFAGAVSSLIGNLTSGMPMIDVANLAIKDFGRAFGMSSDDIREARGVLETVLDTFGDIGDMIAEGDIEGLFELFMDGLSAAADMIGEALQPVADAFTDWFNSIDWQYYGTLMIQRMFEFAGDVMSFIGEAMSNLFTAVVEWFNSVDWASVGAIMWEAIKTYLTGVFAVGGAIVGVLATLFTAVSTWFTEQDWPALATALWDAFTAALTGFFGGIGEDIAPLYDSFVEWANNADWAGMAEGVVNAIVDGLIALWDMAIVFEEWRLDMYAKAGETDWSAIGESIIDAIKVAAGAAIMLANPLLAMQWLEGLLSEVTGIDFGSIGAQIVEGIAAGVSSAANAIQAALMAKAQEAWSAVTSWFNGLGGGGGAPAGAPAGAGAGAAGDAMPGGNRGMQVTNNIIYNVTARNFDPARERLSVLAQYGGI
jgi:TP901 family phage tail tape measure protein